MPGVVSGDYDFSFGNVTSVLLAGSEGLPLRIVANGESSTGDPATDFSAVVVPGGSHIQGAADLDGRRWRSTTSRTSVRSPSARRSRTPAATRSNVEFVELPFPEMPAAVAGGNVDAAWVVEPFVTVATGQGARAVFYPFAEPIEDLTVATYFTTEPIIQEDPELVDEFQAAIKESLAVRQQTTRTRSAGSSSPTPRSPRRPRRPSGCRRSRRRSTWSRWRRSPS